MRRKSPISHRVVGYTRRDGTRISPHTRGSGQRLSRPSKTVGKSFDEDTRMEDLAFTVNFKYSDKPKDGESVIVIADTYQRALEEAFDERVDTRMPIEVGMVDPDLNQILKFIGEGAKKAGAFGLKSIKKAGQIGAKYGIRAVKAGTRLGVKGAKAVARGVKVGLTESSKLALYEIERARVRRLIVQAYSTDPIERKAARIAIRRVYPDIYDLCHFSRDRVLKARPMPRLVPPRKQVPARVVR